jgi:hypothetical protein
MFGSIFGTMLGTVIEKTEHYLEIIKKPVYMGSLFILHLAYVLVFFGIIQYTPTFVNNLNILIQIFVCIFLMIKFHPFRKHELKEFDSTIIFGSAMFLLTSIGFTQFLTNYFGKKVADNIKKQNNNLNKPI